MMGTKQSAGVWIPFGQRILVKRSGSKGKTKGGIILPDEAKIPQIRGEVIQVGHDVESYLYPIEPGDDVLFLLKNSVPVDLEDSFDNGCFVIPIEDVIAVFRKNSPNDVE